LYNELGLQKIKLFFIFFIFPFVVKAQTDFRNDNYIPTKNLWGDSSTFETVKLYKKDSIQVRWVPLLNKLQYVQAHPYNWNDGAMVPAKGWQQFIRAGVNAQWKFVEIQIAPEMGLAQNQLFDGLPLDADQVLWRDYYRFYNFIELPERMGDKSYNKISWGQSFLKLHYKNWQVGISNENKWWGPAQRNALLLSNTAAGFPHITIGTSKPVSSKIGDFNIELIAGKLTNGGWTPPSIFMPLRGNPLYVPKENHSRIINGINISYQPKWVPNLNIGFEQTYVQYEKDMTKWTDHIPVKNIFYNIPDDGLYQPIILTAFYFNYTMPEANTTLYGEVGWNLQRTSLRNWVLQPDKGYASTWGIKKIFTTNKKYYWELLGELTQVQLLTRAEQFSTGIPTSWYLGSNVRQGYTHDGQLLGAGVGPGGSSQTVEFNWRKNNNRIGITGERRVHNNDYYQFAYTASGQFKQYYVDFITTLKVDWRIKKYRIGPRVSYMQTNNYQWEWFPTKKTGWIPGRDIQQVMLQLNLLYDL
jgi:hypothetical protein